MYKDISYKRNTLDPDSRINLIWGADKQSNAFYDNFWMSWVSETIDTYTYEDKDVRIEEVAEPDESQTLARASIVRTYVDREEKWIR